MRYKVSLTMLDDKGLNKGGTMVYVTATIVAKSITIQWKDKDWEEHQLLEFREDARSYQNHEIAELVAIEIGCNVGEVEVMRE